MASTARPMKMPSGQVIWIRVDEDEDANHGVEENGAEETPVPQVPAGSGLFSRRRRRMTVVPAADAQQLQGFTDTVSGIAESVRDGLKHAAPDTVEIEFGINIDVSAGVAVSLLADAHAKADVRITLGWKSDRYEPGGGTELSA